MLCFVFALLVTNASMLAVAFSQVPKNPLPNAEVAIREADESWAKATTAKSIVKKLNMYDAEAVTAGSAMPPAKGIAEIRAMWTKYFAQPDFSLTWKLGKVLTTESGTIAYSSGTWIYASKPIGPYLAVWRKQPNGSWKILIDAAWNPQPAK